MKSIPEAPSSGFLYVERHLVLWGDVQRCQGTDAVAVGATEQGPCDEGPSLERFALELPSRLHPGRWALLELAGGLEYGVVGRIAAHDHRSDGGAVTVTANDSEAGRTWRATAKEQDHDSCRGASGEPASRGHARNLGPEQRSEVILVRRRHRIVTKRAHRHDRSAACPDGSGSRRERGPETEVGDLRSVGSLVERIETTAANSDQSETIGILARDFHDPFRQQRRAAQLANFAQGQ